MSFFNIENNILMKFGMHVSETLPAGKQESNNKLIYACDYHYLRILSFTPTINFSSDFMLSSMLSSQFVRPYLLFTMQLLKIEHCGCVFGFLVTIDETND